MADKYWRERKWIRSTLSKKGETQERLLVHVAKFCAKSERDVAEQKDLSRPEVQERQAFMRRVYHLLNNEEFDQTSRQYKDRRAAYYQSRGFQRIREQQQKRW